MNTVLEWLRANPLVWELLAWPVVTFLVTALFKPRTPEQYAAMHPRLAAVLQLVGSLGLDAPKILESLHKLATGHAAPVPEERAKLRAQQRGQK